MTARPSSALPASPSAQKPSGSAAKPAVGASLSAAFKGVPLVAQERIPTPLGDMTALATSRGLAGLWFDAQTHHPGDLDAPTDPQHPALLATAHWLSRYWSSTHQTLRSARPAWPEVPLDLHGTAFQQAIWRALFSIAPGSTRTYGDMAQAAGSPAAVRAAGAAIGRNPVGILVPCHRVIGRDGSLTGYAGGMARKVHLLQHEGALL